MLHPVHIFKKIPLIIFPPNNRLKKIKFKNENVDLRIKCLTNLNLQLFKNEKLLFYQYFFLGVGFLTIISYFIEKRIKLYFSFLFCF